MPLTAGTRLGSYEILAPVGHGGMGEVYRAIDRRLGRTLAIKVLPAGASGNPARRERFEREARTIAGLSHPNICTLHDIGRDAGVDFLVLEYVEAPTLGDCLLNGPLRLDRLLRAAIEIADALDHAHRHGVVHRDLKPANIMLAESGVKVLDFGLAKLRAPDTLPGLSTVSAGVPPLTAVDEILGTFQYMAPEQLEGGDADPRTDIFALGAVIYEMATGRRPFGASSQAGTIGAILHTAPPSMQSLEPGTPRALARAVARCLEKDPDNRWQTARDLKRELEWIAAHGSSAEGRSSGRLTLVKRTTAWAAAAVVAAAGLSLAFAHFRAPSVDRRVVQLSIVPAHPSNDFSLSPDGRFLVYAAGGQNDFRLWLRPLDAPAAHPLEGTEGAALPFWSPDSRSIAFGAGGKLKKIAVSDGQVVTICDATTLIGGTWSRDGVILFAPGNRTPLYRVAAAGGEPARVTMLDRSRGENTHRYPHFLPDGRRFVYLARSSRADESGIYAGSLDSAATTRVAGADSSVAYAAPGYLLFARRGALVAQPVDAATLRSRGEPIQVAADVGYSSADSRAAFSLSEHGEIAYQTSASAPRSELASFTRSGQRLDLPGAAGNIADPTLSFDGTRVAVMRWANATSDVWVVDETRASTSRLTLDPAVDYAPIWSPDGGSIVFASNRDGPSDLFTIPSGGGARDASLVASAEVKHPTDWALDGRLIVFESRSEQTDWDLWTVPAGGGRAVPLLQTEFAERLGRLAPNGRWLAYVSNETGRDEVYVRPFPPAAGKWMISTAGGTEPRWRRDGGELFYVAGDRRLMAVSVTTAAAFSQGIPQELFETRMIEDRSWGFDVSPDGRRFVVSVEAGASTPAPVHIVLGWLAAARR
jgi:serine/threonine protein kinase/Tol biopolymer transport system component